MELLQLREKEIFETLKKLKERKFVVIGGYAVNAYTLPRFSQDCDIVVKDDSEAQDIQKQLLKTGYSKVPINKLDLPYHCYFERYEKKVQEDFVVSMDILVKEILDRQTGATFSAEWVFENSEVRTLRGKTIREKLNLRVVNLDALFVMKMISCRSTDIRDVFMLAPHIKDKAWIRQEISKRYDFNNRYTMVKQKITSRQFKDGLQGVFGYIHNDIFEKHKTAFLELNK